ncbi:MAG: hypothetical protein KDM64_09725 [Verrucomicrobiae bacterium]|nr:hypothetical protein [Verrucomicrobiae bacterium]
MACAMLGLVTTFPEVSRSQDAKQPVVESGKQVVSEATPLDRGLETEMDLPSDFHKYYGQRVNQWRDIERKIAKLDIDADMNYDGTIDNSDPADNGAFESTPPGVMLGEGELTKVLIRITPYRIDYKGEVVLTLEVAGINRAAKSGQFDSFEEETAATGHIKVWKDASRRELLLDSADPEKRYYEWYAEDTVYPANLPGVFPRFVYVEGVSVAGSAKGLSAKEVISGKGVAEGGYYSGDLRLLATISHREPGAERESYPEYRKRFLKSYRTTFDHILFTVLEQPQEKVFINNNAEGVWVSAGK